MMADNDSLERSQSNLRTPSRSSTSVRFLRRSSTNDRINEILDNARTRADTMTSETSGATKSNRRSPALRSDTLHPPEQPNTDSNSGTDDDTLTLESRQSGVGPRYQALRTSETDLSRRSSGLRNNPRRRPAGQEHGAQSRAVGEERVQPQEEAEDSGLWKSVMGKYRSIELENKGSVARDHLALERTFLAWLRTSLSFASIGIAVTQLFRLNTSLSEDKDNGQPDLKNATLRHMGKPLGATFLGISILTLLLGYRRYIESQEWVIKGKFPASRGTIAIIAFVAFGIMVVSLVVVIAIHPDVDPDDL